MAQTGFCLKGKTAGENPLTASHGPLFCFQGARLASSRLRRKKKNRAMGWFLRQSILKQILDNLAQPGLSVFEARYPLFGAGKSKGKPMPFVFVICLGGPITKNKRATHVLWFAGTPRFESKPSKCSRTHVISCLQALAGDATHCQVAIQGPIGPAHHRPFLQVAPRCNVDGFCWRLQVGPLLLLIFASMPTCSDANIQGFAQQLAACYLWYTE